MTTTITLHGVLRVVLGDEAELIGRSGNHLGFSRDIKIIHADGHDTEIALFSDDPRSLEVENEETVTIG